MHPKTEWMMWLDSPPHKASCLDQIHVLKHDGIDDTRALKHSQHDVTSYIHSYDYQVIMILQGWLLSTNEDDDSHQQDGMVYSAKITTSYSHHQLDQITL